VNVKASHAHISKRAEHLGLLLVLLDVLAEGTVAELHIRELILILNEEATAVLAHSNRHVWHHVLVVPFRQVRTKVIHVLNEDFLEAHASHYFLIDVDGLVVFRCRLMFCVLEQTLGEEIILDALVVIVH